MGIGFVFGFLGFASACGTPFYLANDSADDLRIKTKIPPPPPRKRHRAINLDKPKVDAGYF